jgi:CubicO group peptidase (beta-lactamase class C family)
VEASRSRYRAGAGDVPGVVAMLTDRSGTTGLASTFFWIDPANGVGGVYLSQVLPFVDVRSAPLFLEFQKAACQA